MPDLPCSTRRLAQGAATVNVWSAAIGCALTAGRGVISTCTSSLSPALAATLVKSSRPTTSLVFPALALVIGADFVHTGSAALGLAPFVDVEVLPASAVGAGLSACGRTDTTNDEDDSGISTFNSTS